MKKSKRYNSLYTLLCLLNMDKIIAAAVKLDSKNLVRKKLMQSRPQKLIKKTIWCYIYLMGCKTFFLRLLRCMYVRIEFLARPCYGFFNHQDWSMYVQASKGSLSLNPVNVIVQKLAKVAISWIHILPNNKMMNTFLLCLLFCFPFTYFEHSPLPKAISSKRKGFESLP